MLVMHINTMPKLGAFAYKHATFRAYTMSVLCTYCLYLQGNAERDAFVCALCATTMPNWVHLYAKWMHYYNWGICVVAAMRMLLMYINTCKTCTFAYAVACALYVQLLMHCMRNWFGHCRCNCFGHCMGCCFCIACEHNTYNAQGQIIMYINTM